MAQTLDLFLNLGALFSVGQADLRADDSTPKGYAPGAISWMIDAFGPKIFRYGKSVASGEKGELMSKPADETGTVTAAAGEVNDTTHFADTTNWASANLAQGKIFHVTDNNDVAGGPPEGEVSVIASYGVSQATLDSRYPLSLAPAVSDTWRGLSVFHTEDAADGDLAVIVYGICMATRTAGHFGWYQNYGMNPGALYETNAVTAGAPIVAMAACVSA